MCAPFRIAAIAAALAVAGPAVAGPPFDVDDPGTAEKGSLELNLAYTSSQTSEGETQQFPLLDMSFGVTNNAEVALTLAGASVRDAGRKRVTAFDDTAVGAKWRLVEETARRPQIGLSYSLSLPTASPAGRIGAGASGHTLLALAQKSFGPTAVAVNVGRDMPRGADSRPNWVYGCLVTTQTGERITIGVQLFGNSSPAVGERDDLAWGAGVTYAVAPDRTLMCRIGRSERGSSDLNLYAGMQFVFR